MKKTKNIVQLFLSIFIMFLMSGCLPNNEELQVMLNQHNITKKIYIKNDTEAYDDYKETKKVLQTLKRGQEYDVVDIKGNFIRVAKSASNKLKNDVWISLDEIELEPTYFITLTVETPNSKILLNEKEYEANKRYAKGNYKVEISADNFLPKSFEIELNKDIEEEITLDFDIDTELERLEEKRLEKEEIEKIQRKKQERARIAKEIKDNIFIDKKQKLMWQDNSAAIQTKKTWLTKTNYEAKNYFNTKGDTAATYCKNLTLASFKDWRLPAKNELKNLSAQKSDLKNVSASWYWSATSNSNNSERAWSIYLNNGDGYSDLKNASNNVRCVRNTIR